MEKTLTMKLPQEFVSGLARRHNGAEHTKEEIDSTFKMLDERYTLYKKAIKRRENLYDFWDRENVEAYFKRPKWYNAHSRLKRVEREIADTHRVMFRLLTHFDGNYNQVFTPGFVISAEEIYEDFKSKYIKEDE